jgi:hypothetical protein
MEGLLVKLLERLLADGGDWRLWFALLVVGAVAAGIRLLLRAKEFRVVIEYMADDK